MPTYYSEERMKELGWIDPKGVAVVRSALRAIIEHENDPNSPVDVFARIAMEALAS